MVPYKIIGRYERLLKLIEDAANNADAFVYYKPVTACFKQDGDKVSFDCFVILKNWKWRPIKSTKRVHIVLHAKERMSGDGALLLASIVRVSYYAVEDDGPKLLHTVHFDYGPPLTCHPIFHVQLADEAVIPPAEESTELNHEVEFEYAPGRCFRDARIPTCDMTLSSVLLCLAADHIGESFFNDFKTEFLTIQAAMPRLAFDDLKNSLQSTAVDFRSSHWFAHMQ